MRAEYKVWVKDSNQKNFKPWDRRWSSKAKAQHHITEMRSKFKEVGWKPIPQMRVIKARNIFAHPAVTHNWSKAERASAYRNRGKRVPGGYLDMNGELVRFG